MKRLMDKTLKVDFLAVIVNHVDLHFSLHKESEFFQRIVWLLVYEHNTALVKIGLKYFLQNVYRHMLSNACIG